MQRLSCDVLVVGCGPAGASAARAAAQQGVDVIVAERRAVVGQPVRCAEFIPAMLVGQVQAGKDYIVQPTKGMRAYLDGECIQDMISPGYIIHRDVFDQALAKEAVAAGAQLLLQHHYTDAPSNIPTSGTVYLTTLRGQVEVCAKVIIGADGPHSRVARGAKLPNIHCIPSAQVRLPLLRPVQHACVYFHDVICGGYAWLFPKGDTANVGLGMVLQRGGMSLQQSLRYHIQHLVALGYVADDILHVTGGWIPAEAPRSCVAGRVLLVGDAAGHTHPITGAGIFQAVMGGRMAGMWAAEAVRRNDFTLLQNYATEWYDFYGETLAHAHMRRVAWEQHTGALQPVIRKYWIGFREYYANV